jgi:hypothetical protein
MPTNDRADIDWAPKVSLSKVRLLYLREAQGACDDELIDEVGWKLFSRCASILEFTEAVQTGRVKCKRCAGLGTETLIERKTRKPAEILKCPVCAWQVRWRVYVKEAEKTGNIYAGHAQAAFEQFVQVYPQCREAREKIIAIDQLIHEFHWVIMNEDDSAEGFKPAGVNLLQGSSAQVLALLDELTYGKNAPAEVRAMRDWWFAQKDRAMKANARPKK